MSEPPQAEPHDRDDSPGKTRTWWHPLLTRLLDHALASAYTVRDEVLVGKLPLRLDILLIRREAGQLSDSARRDLGVLLPLLNRFTLVEFKGPTDSLQSGDVAHLVGCSFHWHSQQAERPAQEEISLIILAPAANEPIRDELRSIGWQIAQQQPGVLRVVGSPLATWLVETDVLAGQAQPILSLVSRVFLKEHPRIIRELRQAGHQSLLHYMLQQVSQFRRLGEGFAMQHADAEYLDTVEEELATALLESLPPERRLRGLPPEERVRGLSPEELAAGLSEEQAARLRELLEQRKQQ